MFQGLTGIHLIIILGIIVLLFGATKLPALAKGLGQSITIFKKEMETNHDAPTTTTTTTTAAPQAGTVQQEPVLNPAPSVQPQSDHRV
ncbi:twin-arginine translocase TatA/TatE family subunit [Curtobacterium sp. MCBD17_003]|uniref:twin-arginine translocase TatA/TatE family subunit n=1 Tax=Curtobacterium sp. MCBD17_003 TaxID=2175667 RepID=UPI000DA6FB08|nr:twin-arginine translocase TatA/TatE family subunit [Curtobacterium sp. MCBD17_003]WIE55114.1 twin-arginine translocase TatA/TatE family subunit [Curtobacterium sp. MCBD17_003]